MNTQHVRHSAKPHLYTFVEDVVLLGPRMMAASLEQVMHLLRGHPDRHARHGGCCHIPETECPPRCVCHIRWEAAPGQKQQSTIRVTNTSRTVRNFTFSAGPFHGAGNPGGTLSVTPATATLQPGQSIVVSATFTPTSAFQVGETYESEMLIRGGYEQCVCFSLAVVSEQHTHCEVEQADPPLHIKAHHWYDHFQCVEPCFPLHRREPDPAQSA
jgi:hypothetical protein